MFFFKKVNFAEQFYKTLILTYLKNEQTNCSQLDFNKMHTRLTLKCVCFAFKQKWLANCIYFCKGTASIP